MGSPAPTLLPHTAGMFQLGGDNDGFTDACVKALQKCGYDPDDFGTHKQVKKKISDAKAVRDEYNQALAKGTKPLPRQPTEHEAMLARCEAGHLSQDRLFHEAGDGNRGKPCKNNLPPDGDARGYEEGQAPCMPMQTFGPDGGGNIGSPHWAVGRAEAQQKKDNPGVVNEKKLADNSQANVTLALREGPEAKKDFNQKIRNLPDTPEASKPERIDEARERRDAAVSMQQASAKELQGGGGTGGKSGSKDDDAKTAAACIEAFRKVMMAQMRREAIQKYGKDYKKTAAAAQAKKDAGEKAYQDAKKELESGKKLTPKRRAELEQQKKDGLSQKIAGATELRDAKCLNTQVRSLCGASNIEPDNRGCNPPNPLPLPMLTGVQGCNPPKPSGNP